MTEVTVEGVTYRRGKSVSHIPVNGTLFFQGDALFKNTEEGFACYYPTLRHPGWERIGIHGAKTYYEAIVVDKAPEWVEVKNGYYASLENGETYHEAAEALSKDITETIKAQRIRIHNVDGSVTEYKRMTGASPGMEWGVFYPEDKGEWKWCWAANVQDHIQLAFMRGSKVEVLG